MRLNFICKSNHATCISYYKCHPLPATTTTRLSKRSICYNQSYLALDISWVNVYNIKKSVSPARERYYTLVYAYNKHHCHTHISIWEMNGFRLHKHGLAHSRYIYTHPLFKIQEVNIKIETNSTNLDTLT